MAKFSSIAKGARARKPITIPLMGGIEASCALVPLLADQEIAVLAEARASAVTKGIADPKDGEPIYELAKLVHTLVHTCVDVDSPEQAPEPFFDGGAAQILDPKHGLDRDRIALIYQQQRLWQDECAPPVGDLAPEEFIAQLIAHAEASDGSELPFEQWRPAIQRSFVRFTARMAVSSLQLKSLFGSNSPDTTASSRTSATGSVEEQ